jgi:type I restriction enzyme S subunit
MAINQDLKAFIPTKDVDPEYLLHVFLAEGERIRARCMKIGTTVESIGTKALAGYPVLLPPLPEQQKIAAILSSVEDAIAATRMVIEETKRVKQGLLQTLMTRGIGHTRFKKTEIGEVPETWDVRPLRELAEFQNGMAIKPEQWQNDGLPIVRIPQLSNQEDIEHYINSNEVQTRYIVEPGDLLFSWSGSLTIARWASESAALNQHIFNVRPRASTDRDFLEFLLQYSVEALEARTHGTTMRHLTKRTLLAFTVPRPPIEEQQEIALRMAGVQYTQKCHGMVEQTLNDLKRGLMQDLLTGRVRVQTD